MLLVFFSSAVDGSPQTYEVRGEARAADVLAPELSAGPNYKVRVEIID